MGYTYRTALVTGASSGVGQACARLLAAEGVSLVIAARRVDRLDALATELVDRYGVGVEVIGADLSDAKDVTRLEERLTEPERPIELLVSNAGFATAGGFAELPVELSLDAIAVNVIAPVRLIRAALPGMVARGKGGVLVVSSLVASLPMPRSATYGATKAFLSSFSESLYMEARQQGVHVTSVAAGLVRTEFHSTAGINTDGIPDMAWMKPEQVAQAGLEAVAAGKVTVVPGALNKMQVPFFRMAPRALLRRWAKWS
jgi:uncharacterized protein